MKIGEAGKDGKTPSDDDQLLFRAEIRGIFGIKGNKKQRKRRRRLN